MAEINARALMFNLGREDAIDSTTSSKIARYAERKQLAYKLTDEGVLLLDGRGKKIHLRNGVVTLRNALGLHALPERCRAIGDNRVLNKQQQRTNVVTMLHVRKMALVDPRLLKSLRENPTPLPDAIDTALRDLDAEMTSILDGSDADESENVLSSVSVHAHMGVVRTKSGLASPTRTTRDQLIIFIDIITQIHFLEGRRRSRCMPGSASASASASFIFYSTVVIRISSLILIFIYRTRKKNESGPQPSDHVASALSITPRRHPRYPTSYE